MKVKIEDIIVEERIRFTSGEDITELMASLQKLGQLHAITVKYLPELEKYRLIAGFRRLNAATKLGWVYIEGNVRHDLSELDEIDIEIEENFRRKNLDSFEMDIAVAKRERIRKELFPEKVQGGSLKTAHRYVKGKKKGQRKKEPIRDKLSVVALKKPQVKDDNEVIKQTMAKSTAEILDVSPRTVRRRAEVGEAILEKKFDEQKIEDYKKGKIAHSQMVKILQDERKAEKEAERIRKLEVGKKKAIEVIKEESIPEVKEEIIPESIVVPPPKPKICENCEDLLIADCPHCDKVVVICMWGLLNKVTDKGCDEFVRKKDENNI
jgi:ParB-like chromosome segregation protein Spo0J